MQGLHEYDKYYYKTQNEDKHINKLIHVQSIVNTLQILRVNMNHCKLNKLSYCT